MGTHFEEFVVRTSTELFMLLMAVAAYRRFKS